MVIFKEPVKTYLFSFHPRGSTFPFLSLFIQKVVDQES